MFRFRYSIDSKTGKKWWLIERRFLFLFWIKQKKYKYKILEDGSPNLNEIMEYVDILNKND